DKDDRNRVYRTLYAQLQDEIRRKGRNSPRAQAILEGMGMLPQLGAKRANFRRAYIENPVGWRSLPRDPDDIPYGHWH
ncbi:MAG TPA: hypothetical protein VGV38_05305, partial [Pyrinomonadaceae bacterium]|nr:hypothetical protein [Pyrinomonadaceae bacterium]